MALSNRLTILYTTLMGGITFILGALVYGLVSIILIEQIDEALIVTFEDIRRAAIVDTAGQLEFINLSSLDVAAGVFVQAWSQDGSLQATNIPQFTQSLDPEGLHSSQPIFREVTVVGVHLRVLSVPLAIGERPAGVIQLATSLEVVDATQRALVTVLFVGSLLAMALAGLASWFTTRRALAPLKAVTQTALQITRADDLSRRILYQGSPDDEVGQLILAFNQTLSRLENLFNTQRRFLTDVGHELRTPLTVIKGNVALMRRFGPDEESMDTIESEVDRLTRMVGDLLLLAQAESGKLPLDKRVVELDTVLLEVMQQMSVLARDRLKLNITEIDQVLVCGDQDRLKQVLVNLIGNAIKYTPPGGEVTVSIGKEEQKARVTVADNGPGIPAEDLPHIFERFYRAEKSRTRSKDGKGFGLGLSIAYWIIRNHGGSIEVESKEGAGTRFCIWLDLAQGECSE